MLQRCSVRRQKTTLGKANNVACWLSSKEKSHDNCFDTSYSVDNAARLVRLNGVKSVDREVENIGAFREQVIKKHGILYKILS